MQWIGKDSFNLGLSKALQQIKEVYTDILIDATYQEFRHKLIGLKSKMDKTEAQFEANLNSLNFILKADPKGLTETKTIAKDTVLTQDLVISKNQHLIIEKGISIYLDNDSDLIVNAGKLTMNGTEIEPIQMIAKTNSNSSIFIQTGQNTTIEHSSFKNFSGLHKGTWQLPSAITLYESNASFKNCTFIDNYNSDDMVNVFKCDAITFENCTFKNVKSDALDSDFSNVVVSNCIFSNVGNDGVDGSGSNISIENSSFSQVEDKAISAGEESSFKTQNNEIINSELGLVCKDGSILISSNEVLKNNTLDVVAFKKKVIYSPPSITLKNTIVNSNLVEKEAIIEGLKSPVFSKNINKKLYGNQFGKASE